MNLFARLMRSLLRLGPADYRNRYADEIVSLAVARVAEVRGVSRVGRAFRELLDLAVVVRRERRRGRSTGSGSWTDLRVAWRAVRRRPAEAIAMCAILGAGIGAGGLGFNLLSTVLLRPLPFGDPNQLVLLWSHVPQMQFGTPDQPLHGLRMLELRKSMTSAASVEGFKADVFNLDAPGIERERIDGLRTTATLFDTLRVRPARGRFFAATEDVDGAPCVAVIGYGLWQRRFGGRADIAGTAVRLNGAGCTIVGVAPRGFEFPRGGEMPPSFQYPVRTELWVASPPPRTGPSDLTVLARLRPATTSAQAQAELDVQAADRDKRIPGSKGWNLIRVEPLVRQIVSPAITATVGGLFGAVVILLLVAAGNGAQLALVRSLTQQRDLAVCAALGAGRGQLIRWSIGQSVVIALIGGLGGSSLCIAGIRLVRDFGPARFPRLGEATFDVGTAAVLAVATMLCAAVMSVGPAWIASRTASGVLHGRERATSDPLRRWRAVLIAVQVGLAVVVTAACTLHVRSFIARMHVVLGFDPRDTLAFEVTLPPQEYPETLRGAMPAVRPAVIQAVDRFLTTLRAIPGVDEAAIGKPLPMSGAQEATVVAYDDMPRPRTSADIPIAEYIVVSDQLFAAIGTPMLAGREFTAADRETSENAVVVNDTLARQFWPGRSAIGHHMKIGGSMKNAVPLLTVIGVVPDMKRYRLDDSPGPAMYVSYTQGAYPSLGTLPVVVRSHTRRPGDLIGDVRAAVKAAQLDVPVAAAAPMASMVAAASDDAAFAMELMIAIASASVLLIVAGLYGAVAFAVSRRRRELGIRLALGAAPAAIVRLVVAEGARPAAIGVGVGLVGAGLAGAIMRRFLFGISRTEPWTVAAVPVVLVLVVAAACVVPGRRAAAIDPRETLAGE